MHAFLLNLGYGLNFLALTVRDVLWLRLVLLPAQISFLTWGATSGILSTVIWNVVFIVVNLLHIVPLIRERRPVVLPEALAQVYRQTFSSMRARDFWVFWEVGRVQRVCGERLVRQGERPEELMLLVSGNARVMKDGVDIAELEPGQFVAEMSFLSGNRASADVVAIGDVELRLWNQSALASLETINPRLLLKLQRVLSRDVTAKAHASTRRAAAETRQ